MEVFVKTNMMSLYVTALTPPTEVLSVEEVSNQYNAEEIFDTLLNYT